MADGVPSRPSPACGRRVRIGALKLRTNQEERFCKATDLSWRQDGLGMDGVAFKKIKLAHMRLSLFGVSREEDDRQFF